MPFEPKQGQEWRTEPEIDAERQAELAARRSITPDVAQGIYPFSSSFLPGSPQSTVTAFEAVTGLIFDGVFIAMLT